MGINFCFVGDKKYVENYTSPLMKSIRHYHPNCEFHIICSSDFNETLLPFKVYKYVTSPIVKNYYTRAEHAHITDDALLKFHMFKLLPDNKYVYTDIDTICMGDYSEALDKCTDISAVEEFYNYVYDPEHADPNISMPGYRHDGVSFSKWASGTILFDITKNRDLFNKAVEFLKTEEAKIYKGDTEIFNAIHPHYDTLGQEYDYNEYLFTWKRFVENRREEYEAYLKIYTDGLCKNLHYSGGAEFKPWTKNSKAIHAFEWKRWL